MQGLSVSSRASIPNLWQRKRRDKADGKAVAPPTSRKSSTNSRVLPSAQDPEVAESQHSAADVYGKGRPVLSIISPCPGYIVSVEKASISLVP